MIDWYERRDELKPGQVFRIRDGNLVKLDRRVSGDGTDWYVADCFNGHFYYDGSTAHPSDLVERIETAA